MEYGPFIDAVIFYTYVTYVKLSEDIPIFFGIPSHE